jgi:glycerophosphoryl diester phosphodiesterase
VSQFAPEDSQGTIDLVSNGDITFEADRDQDGAGDLVFRTGGVERARIKHDGSGTGWPNVLGGSGPAVASVATAPFIIPHQGGDFVVPEHTMSGYEHSAGYFKFVDTDVWPLADGQLAVMHDSTVDRTTSGSGNVSDLNSQVFKLLTVDANSWLAPAWPSSGINPPLLADVFRRFRGTAVVISEAKDGTSATVQKIVDLATRCNMKTSVWVACTNLSALAPATAAGMATMQVTDTPDPVALAAAGVSYVCMNGTNVTDAAVAAAVAAGLKVIVWNAYRQYDYAHWTGLGAVGVYSNDPFYTAALAKRTSDRFADQTFYPGTIMDVNDRGSFIGTNRYGYTAAENAVTLLGAISPIAAGSYTITFSITFDAAGATGSAAAGLVICAPDDRAQKMNIAGAGYQSGYYVNLNKAGTLAVARLDAPSTSTQIGTVATTAPTDGTTATVKVTVSPTQISIQRTDGTPSTTTTVTDSTYRGGYVHLVQQSLGGLMHVSFSAISVS